MAAESLNVTQKKIEDFKLTIPVLLIGFNRPDTTKEVFRRIKLAKPQKLYISVDGARNNKPGEFELVGQVKQIVKNVDWPCETHYLFNEVNLGAEVTVSSAISWVFDSEEFVIVLEDDIVAPISFFKFMQEMLLKYKDDERLGTVTGNNFTPIDLDNDDDYFFAKYGHSWGWGTWKRAWKNFDLNLVVPEAHLTPTFLKKITNSKAEQKYYLKRFKSINDNGPGKSTWDIVGLYYFRTNNKLSVIPRVNLTSNIGVYGLHANGETDHHFRSFDDSFEVNNHPKEVKCFTRYDVHHFKTFIKPDKPLLKRVVNKIRSLFISNK